MDPRYDWLNLQIDRLQAGESLKRSTPGAGYEPQAGDAAILMMAAQMNGLRGEAAGPDPGFVANLRNRVRDACLGRQG